MKRPVKTRQPPTKIVDFYLTEEERSSVVWRNVNERLERMLVKKRAENDNPKLTDVETATLRGHIECLKALIALGRTPPPMTAPEARPGSRPDYGAKYG